MSQHGLYFSTFWSNRVDFDFVTCGDAEHNHFLDYDMEKGRATPVWLCI